MAAAIPQCSLSDKAETEYASVCSSATACVSSRSCFITGNPPATATAARRPWTVPDLDTTFSSCKPAQQREALGRAARAAHAAARPTHACSRRRQNRSVQMNLLPTRIVGICAIIIMHREPSPLALLRQQPLSSSPCLASSTARRLHATGDPLRASVRPERAGAYHPGKRDHMLHGRPEAVSSLLPPPSPPPPLPPLGSFVRVDVASHRRPARTWPRARDTIT